MAKKTKYSVTFPDGLTLTRSSDRTYTHAWRTTATTDSGRRVARSGFAASLELATKASAASERAFIRTRHQDARCEVAAVTAS